MNIRLAALAMATGLAAAACAPAVTTVGVEPGPATASGPPQPDPRIGLRAGLFDAGEAVWNMRVLSATPPPSDFVGGVNSDLAFTGNYAIQGNYLGFQVWDISNPARPELVRGFVCPASQSDVSVYRNLLFVSGEGLEGRLDCGTEGVQQQVSADRLRGIRIFDISDIRNPRYVGNVQTCRGSHTHTVLEHPGDTENVYVYVSGSAPVRPEAELEGCIGAPPAEDPRSALFRIEVIRVPLADPASAAIVSSPRIFDDLTAPPQHGPSPADLAELEARRAEGAFIADVMGEMYVLPDAFVAQLLSGIIQRRGGTGNPTAADSAQLRQELPAIIQQMMGAQGIDPDAGPTQCHDITVYPEIGLAGGACEGYGLLLDIRNPIDPRRLAAVADSNFAYWHSATFNNDGTTLLFTDEWGGGGGAKCRADDPMEWGANAIFSVENGRLVFRSYYKLPAPQTAAENCVAHNGSLVPVPGRDIKVQAWYQGGISVFDFTDPANPYEIAFHDRGPLDADEMVMAGSWSAYWYNGVIVSSEIARGLDILELVPSEHLTQNEIDAANSVRLAEFNPQGQPRFTWAPSFAVARSYVDQLERSRGLSASELAAARSALAAAEQASGAARREALTRLAGEMDGRVAGSADAAKVRMLAGALRDLAGATE
ncbi:MAG TPA: hypothetical protein VK929_09385 [Longimicrobiales bacterium]|nr:hypothetical protein [Longimicrobiales bacterium]